MIRSELYVVTSLSYPFLSCPTLYYPILLNALLFHPVLPFTVFTIDIIPFRCKKTIIFLLTWFFVAWIWRDYYLSIISPLHSALFNFIISCFFIFHFYHHPHFSTLFSLFTSQISLSLFSWLYILLLVRTRCEDRGSVPHRRWIHRRGTVYLLVV